MRKPLVGYDNFLMGSQSRFDSPGLPLPEYYISFSVTATYPFSVGWKPNLAGITRNRMPSKSFLTILTEIIRTIYQYLVVEWLSSEIFFWQRNNEHEETRHVWLWNLLDGWSVTAGMECMCGSAMYLITTGMSKSQALIVLSSEVVTNRRFSSTKVIVLTGPRCWSYSCVISPEFISYCGQCRVSPPPFHSSGARRSPELFSYPTYRPEKCFVYLCRDEIGQHKESCRCWIASNIGQSLYPIVSCNDRIRTTRIGDHHSKK